MASKFLVLLLLCYFVSASLAVIDEEDIKLTVPEIISKYGYICETHHVTTEDGYILELHRIPNHRHAGPSPYKKPVVLLQHGLFSNSANWVIGGLENGFAYFLAECGYDVWLGNTRGNRYSNKHVTLKPSQSEFWSFGWHEMAVYDLPAMIDFIHNIQNSDQSFNYIGHGQGTTVFYAMCSEKPTQCSKIDHMMSLATAAYMSNASSLTTIITKLIELLKQSPQSLNPFPSPSLVYPWCENPIGIEELLCKNILFAMSGYNLETLNTELVPIIMGHTPDPVSFKQLMHFIQLAKSGEFQQYDYGAIQNMIKYNSTQPPKYNISRVTSRVMLFYTRGNTDGLSDEKDAIKLQNELPNAAEMYLVRKNYGHLEYYWGKNITKILYKYIAPWLGK